MRITVIIAGLSALLWLGAVGSIVMVSVQSARGQRIKNGKFLIIGLIVAAIVVSTLSAGLVFVEPQERGVVISALAPRGYREAALQPGLRPLWNV